MFRMACQTTDKQIFLMSFSLQKINTIFGIEKNGYDKIGWDMFRFICW